MSTTTLVGVGPASAGTERVRAVDRPAVRLGAFVLAMTGVAAVLMANLLRGIGAQNIQDWDEARHAVNAYEMLQRGNWLVHTWRGDVDYWNLKPPLSMWAQMLSFQLFGFTPFAVRLPAVIATVLTVAVVAAFAHRVAGRIASIVAALALVTCPPFITVHAARTGDPDGLFLLGTSVALLAVLLAPQHPRLLLLATAGFSIAFLTKSFHAALLVPFAAGYLIWRRNGRVRPAHLLVGAAGLLPVLLWVVARYLVDGPRFLSAMFLVDVLHRTERPAEGNAGGPLYYVKLLAHFYGPWLAVLVIAGAVWLVARRRGTSAAFGDRPVLVGLAVWAAAVFAAFSPMATKLPWYTLPAYPALAALIGVLVARAMHRAGGPRLTSMVVAVVLAAEVGQLVVLRSVLDEHPDRLQVALQALHRDPRLAGRQVFLDPAVGPWRPGRIASAELNGDLVPAPGGVGAAREEPSSLIVVRRDSKLDRRSTYAASAVLARTADYLILPAAAVQPKATPHAAEKHKRHHRPASAG